MITDYKCKYSKALQWQVFLVGVPEPRLVTVEPWEQDWHLFMGPHRVPDKYPSTWASDRDGPKLKGPIVDDTGNTINPAHVLYISAPIELPRQLHTIVETLQDPVYEDVRTGWLTVERRPAPGKFNERHKLLYAALYDGDRLIRETGQRPVTPQAADGGAD